MKKLNEMKIHIIGIGGTGMAPIAVVLHEMGVDVSGSDRSESVYTQALRAQGIRVMVPQTAENIADPDMVFYSSAIHDDNPELAEARRRGIPTLKRREFLGLMLSERRTVAIAGSHGKSTTTSMTAWTLSQLGQEPGFIIGSTMKDMGKNATAGSSDWFVIEADEYDNMFLGLVPAVAALTKVEYDHPDCFPTLDAYLDAFNRFLENTVPGGCVLLNADDAEQMQLKAPKDRRLYRYGIENPCDFRAESLTVGANGCYSFDFIVDKECIPVTLSVPGKHNVYNALLVLSICAIMDLDLNAAANALHTFHGISRRFEIVAVWNGITLIDDYAHHPTEIRATLRAAREYFPGQRIWAIWQPHTFSRTQALLTDFSESFVDADEVILTDIFAAREQFNGFGIEDVLRAMRHEHVHHCGSNADVAAKLAAELKSGDVVVTLSAGDANLAAPMALEMLSHAEY